jgi:hypothetical protein
MRRLFRFTSFIIAMVAVSTPLTAEQSQFFLGDFFSERHGIVIADGDTVWCARSRGSGYYLGRMKLATLPEYDPLFDEDEQHPTGRRLVVPAGDTVLFCIKGSNDFKQGSIRVQHFMKPIVSLYSDVNSTRLVPDSFSFTFANNTYRIYSNTSRSPRGMAFNVYVSHGGRRQLLVTEREISEGYATLEWVSDLNGDRYPDILICTSGHYASSTYRLYLSTLRGGRYHLNQVGSFMVGC